MMHRWTVPALCALVFVISVAYWENWENWTSWTWTPPIIMSNISWSLLTPSRPPPLSLTSDLITDVWERMEAVDSENALAPFKKRITSLHYFDPDYKIRYCQIQKNMSTMMMTLFCDLFTRGRSDNGTADPLCYREGAHVLENGTVTSNLPAWRPLRRPDYTHDPIEEDTNSTKLFTNFTIIRDPLDRFVSAYEHICRFEKYCSDEGESVHIFVQALHRFLQDGERFEKLDRPEQMEHIQFHFAPQNWYCHVGDPEDQEKMMLLRYSDDQEANIAMVDNMFEVAGMDEETRDLTLQRMRNQHTWHSGNSSNKHKWLKEIYSNPTTLKSLIRIYYWDYVLLGYTLPKMNDI